jgi:hypothetical protein
MPIDAVFARLSISLLGDLIHPRGIRNPAWDCSAFKLEHEIVIANTILIYPLNGKAAHRFCTEAQAKAALLDLSNTSGSGSMMVADDWPAERVFALSADLRERIELAKEKLNDELKIQRALDEAGIPHDADLRAKVSAVLKRLQS